MRKSKINHWDRMLEEIAKQGKNNKRIPKSGVAGVNWRASINKWNVRIKAHGKGHHLGAFADFFEACCARKSAEARLRT